MAIVVLVVTMDACMANNTHCAHPPTYHLRVAGVQIGQVSRLEELEEVCLLKVGRKRAHHLLPQAPEEGAIQYVLHHAMRVACGGGVLWVRSSVKKATSVAV